MMIISSILILLTICFWLAVGCYPFEFFSRLWDFLKDMAQVVIGKRVMLGGKTYRRIKAHPGNGHYPWQGDLVVVDEEAGHYGCIMLAQARRLASVGLPLENALPRRDRDTDGTDDEVHREMAMAGHSDYRNHPDYVPPRGVDNIDNSVLPTMSYAQGVWSVSGLEVRGTPMYRHFRHKEDAMSFIWQHYGESAIRPFLNWTPVGEERQTEPLLYGVHAINGEWVVRGQSRMGDGFENRQWNLPTWDDVVGLVNAQYGHVVAERVARSGIISVDDNADHADLGRPLDVPRRIIGLNATSLIPTGVRVSDRGYPMLLDFIQHNGTWIVQWYVDRGAPRSENTFRSLSQAYDFIRTTFGDEIHWRINGGTSIIETQVVPSQSKEVLLAIASAGTASTESVGMREFSAVEQQLEDEFELPDDGSLA